MRTFPFELSYLMSPGRNDSPGGTVPIGFSFAFAEAILMPPERSAHTGLALGILVSARRSRSASQSIRARASSTTMKIFRNEYMTRLAILNGLVKANNDFSNLDLDQIAFSFRL